MLGSIVGAFALFWLALLSSGALLNLLPGFSLVSVLVVGVVVGAVSGALFPKVATVVLFPFSTFGGGPA